MPALLAIFLAYNDFNGADVVIFASNIERKSYPNLRFIDIRGIDITKEEYDAIT